MIRPRNFSGDGTALDCGIYATQGETKWGGGVAAAIAAPDPGSAISGLCATAAAINNTSEAIHASSRRNMKPPEIDRGGSLARARWSRGLTGNVCFPGPELKLRISPKVTWLADRPEWRPCAQPFAPLASGSQDLPDDSGAFSFLRLGV